MTLVSDLQSYQDRRRFPNWQPKAPTTTKAFDRDTNEVVKRCLHFLPLELQVANWAIEVEADDNLRYTIEDACEFLLRNAEDEQKHDKVLRMLADYYGVKEAPEEAKVLIDSWHMLNVHPVLAAYTLEMGVFFSILPTLIKYGDVYAATVAQWINDDERCHVETNLRIVKELGLKVSADLARLVFDTVAYIYAPMSEAIAKAQALRAVKRLVSGRDEQMLSDSVPVTIAFFEQHDKRSIVY